MILRTYSRLCVGKGCLTPIATTGGYPFNASCYGEAETSDRGYATNVQFVLPLGDGYYEQKVDDPFDEKESSPQRHTMYHFKLPEYVESANSRVLTRRAIEQTDPERWSGWTMVMGPMKCASPPSDIKYYSSRGWFYRTLSDRVAETICYGYTYYPPQYYGHPAIVIEAARYRIELTEDGRYVSYQSYGQGTTNFVCPASVIDDGMVRSEAWQLVRGGSLEPTKHYVEATSLEDLGETNLSVTITDLFDERNRFNGLGHRNQFDYDWLVQHAFVDACSDIGKMNDNMIQNVIAIVTALWDICRGNFFSLFTDDSPVRFSLDDPKWKLDLEGLDIGHSLGDNWLSYRYQYTTGMLDLKEFSDFLVKRCEQWLNFMDGNYFQRSYGYASRTVEGTFVECRCKVAWRPWVLSGLRAAVKYLHDSGLEVNPYVLWDMVPFSFIADWFFPVGDVATVMSDAKYYTSDYYNFSEISFSLKYDMELGSRYYRWYQDPPLVEGYCWFDDQGHKTRTKTIVKRVLDTGALVFGICVK